VLAVGDQRFQDRCLGKLGDVSSQGRTVLFVSHNMNMVNKLCEKSIFLENGRIKKFDKTTEVMSEYTQGKLDGDSNALKGFSGELAEFVVVNDIVVNGLINQTDTIINPLDTLTIQVNVKCNKNLNTKSTLSIVKDGQVILSQHDGHQCSKMTKGEYQITFEFHEKLLSPGRYSINFGIADPDINQWLWGIDQLYFQVTDQWSDDYQPSESMGVINLLETAQRKKL